MVQEGSHPFHIHFWCNYVFEPLHLVRCILGWSWWTCFSLRALLWPSYFHQWRRYGLVWFSLWKCYRTSWENHHNWRNPLLWSDTLWLSLSDWYFETIPRTLKNITAEFLVWPTTRKQILLSWNIPTQLSKGLIPKKWWFYSVQNSCQI